MDRDLYERIRSIYEQALAAPPDQRPALLDTLCAGDTDLRREVDSLLRIADETLATEHPFSDKHIAQQRARLEARLDDDTPTLTSAGDRPSAPTHDSATLPPGTPIGRFIIDALIGRGGMGAVYSATQQRPNRPVALKLIRARPRDRPAAARPRNPA